MKKILNTIPFLLLCISLYAQSNDKPLTLSPEMILAPTVISAESNIAIMCLYRKNDGTPVDVVEAANLLNQTINLQKTTDFTQITLADGSYTITNDFQEASFRIKSSKITGNVITRIFPAEYRTNSQQSIVEDLKIYDVSNGLNAVLVGHTELNDNTLTMRLYKDGKLESEKQVDVLSDIYACNDKIKAKENRKEYYQNGQLRVERLYDANSRENGLWIYYNENGKITTKVTYVAGNAEGESYRYLDNGEEEFKVYKNDKLVSKKIYYGNGKLKGIELYVDGKKEGDVTYYHDDGSIWFATTYKDGKEVTKDKGATNTNLTENGENTNANGGGLFTQIVEAAEERNKPEEYYEYYDNGNVKLKAFKDKDGNLNGMAIIYYENGTIQAKGNLVNDEFDGDLYSYDEAGVLTELRKFTLGTLNTKYVYFENGKIKSINNYENDLLNGEFKEFYESGELKYHLYYKDNKHHGEGKTYYENGNLESKGNMIEGKQDGLWKYYYDNASLAEEVVFENGEIVSEKKYDRKEKSNSYDDLFVPLMRDNTNNSNSNSTSSSTFFSDAKASGMMSTRDLQLYAKNQLESNFSYFGKPNQVLDFNVYTDSESRKLFFVIKFEISSKNILREKQIMFNDVISISIKEDVIYFDIKDNKQHFRNGNKNSVWEDWKISNLDYIMIPVRGDNLRTELYACFKYLVENPIMKRE